MNQIDAIMIIREAQVTSRANAETDTVLVTNAIETLVNATRKTYSKMSAKYSNLRSDHPSDWDMPMIDLMLETVRGRVASGKLLQSDGRWKLLDIGAGHGRDLEFFGKISDVAPVGIENNDEFLEILAALEKAGRIPILSYMKADMRELTPIVSNSVACVRNHATLHHLPLLWKGVGVDQAISETYRVLQPHGIFYVLVKSGNGLDFIDTNEGLGPRLFQLFTKSSLSCVLERNGFHIFHLEERTEVRSSGSVDWIFALAERT